MEWPMCRRAMMAGGSRALISGGECRRAEEVNFIQRASADERPGMSLTLPSSSAITRSGPLGSLSIYATEAGESSRSRWLRMSRRGRRHFMIEEMMKWLWMKWSGY